MYVIGRNSRRNLKKVHADLIAVVERAIQVTEHDFSVIEGLRSIEQQRRNVQKKASRTMKSKHLVGNAVDLIPYPFEGWNDTQGFRLVGQGMKAAAAELDIPIIWGAVREHGGDWIRFNDMPHFELDEEAYPIDWEEVLQ
jgi:peptidoglycan L-alanyl-D-glutamate endopeptidase CwlK